ncbi:MAG: hypothetical protein IJ600_03630 [Lachnospiraceae bacterium]|nr:hypothetical protein [Lachnospiraceae bacterium]
MNRKRGAGIGVFLKYAVFALYVFGSAMLLFGTTAYAYIDPSVMTYVIQAVAGIVIALGAVFGIYFRKMKKALFRFLRIDENRNKEVESDDVVYHRPEEVGGK